LPTTNPTNHCLLIMACILLTGSGLALYICTHTASPGGSRRKRRKRSRRSNLCFPFSALARTARRFLGPAPAENRLDSFCLKSRAWLFCIYGCSHCGEVLQPKPLVLYPVHFNSKSSLPWDAKRNVAA
jgi:hypothetical protein